MTVSVEERAAAADYLAKMRDDARSYIRTIPERYQADREMWQERVEKCDVAVKVLRGED